MTRIQFRLIFPSVIAAVLISFALPAAATDLPVLGTDIRFGSPIRVVCPGGYLVGFHGRIGSWIDNFQIVCASFDAARRQFVNATPMTPTFGLSQGGAPAEVLCNGDEAVRTITAHDTKGDGPSDVMHTIEFTCVLPTLHFPDKKKYAGAGPIEGRPIFFGTSFTGVFSQECPANELAIGMAGRFGRFVDALGLICGPPPSLAVALPPPPAIAHPGDFTGSWQTHTDRQTVEMTILQNNNRTVDGNYVTQGGDRGTINGNFGANVYQLRWVQGRFRGTAQFFLAADGNSFTGSFTADAHPDLPPPFRQGPWVGTRR